MSFTLLGSVFSVRVQVRMLAALAALLLSMATSARAEVTRVEIASRADLAVSPATKRLSGASSSPSIPPIRATRHRRHRQGAT